MIRGTNQSRIIEAEIMQCLNGGMTDKVEIITKVCDALGTPRPTVRRVKGVLEKKLKGFVKVLE